MAICVQNLLVHGERVACPRLAEGETLPVASCKKKCRFHRAFVSSVSARGNYEKGVGWSKREVRTLTVTCDYPSTFDLAGFGS